MSLTRRFLLLALFVFLPGCSALAQPYASDHYTVFDSVLNAGGYSTSTNFTLSAVISQMAIGTSTAAGYNLFGGFLYFPFVSTPVVSATGGNAQVALSWTSADASTGWAVGGYAIGQSTVAGGPYSYTSVGNVLLSARTGLTNGTPYYFVVRVLDALGNGIATSTQVTATPAAPPPSNEGGGGGGGGGGGSSPTGGGTGVVNLSGRAYPGSRVTLLKDAQIAVTTIAGPDARFTISLFNLSAGSYALSLYGEDGALRRSESVNFPVTVTANTSTDIGGIFLSPTIAVDKAEVKRGDNLAIFGQSANQSTVTIQVNSEQEIFATAKADKDGIYLYNLDTAPLEFGDHSTRSKSAMAGEISTFSQRVPFKVGSANVLTAVEGKKCDRKGNVNGDCKVNLVDFSIVAYWYNRPGPPSNVDINNDGKVTLIDFSIMAYNWTG